MALRTDPGSTHSDRMEVLLQAWGCWLAGGTRGAGYPVKSVLHESWLPPQSGMTPTLATSGPSDATERALHAAVKLLSVRLQNTLVVVYVQRLPVAEQVLRLECGASTVRARVSAAKRMLARAVERD